MSDDRHQAGARLVDRAQALDLGLGFGLQTALFDDPCQDGRERLEEADVGPPEDPPADGLDVEHADDLVVPDERHGAHRGEARFIEALEPGEPAVPADVDADQRLAGLGHPAGDPGAHRQAGHADLATIQAVRRGEGHPGAVAFDEVDRADLGVHGRCRPIDDRAHELVPGAGRGGQPGDRLEKGQLLQPTGVGLRGHAHGVDPARRRPGRSTAQLGVRSVTASGGETATPIATQSAPARARPATDAGRALP